MRSFADQEFIGSEEPEFAALLDFFDQCIRVDDHAITKNAARTSVQDARWHKVRHQLLAIDDKRVPCIRAAAVANDHAGFFTEQVDDLALPFVTPLGTNDDCDGHDGLPASRSMSAPGLERAARFAMDSLSSWAAVSLPMN